MSRPKVKTPRRNAPTKNSNSQSHPAGTLAHPVAQEVNRKLERRVTHPIDPLERRVTDLEDLKLDHHIDIIYRRLKPFEEYRTLAEGAVVKLKNFHQSDLIRQARVGLEVIERVERLEKGLEETRKALRAHGSGNSAGLEGKDLRSLNSDMNTLALEFLDSLHRGGAIDPVVTQKIQLALSKRCTPANSKVRAKGKSEPRKNGPAPRESVTNHRGRPLKHGRDTREGVNAEELLRLIAESDAASNSRSSLSPATAASPSVTETQQQDADVHMTDKKQEDGEDEESTDKIDDPPFRPGERKSARKPKPRTFLDHINWKYVNGTGSTSSPVKRGK